MTAYYNEIDPFAAQWLRSTFAAGLRRGGADVGMVAASLGDRSERMGAHYTRHVEREQKVIMALRSQL